MWDVETKVGCFRDIKYAVQLIHPEVRYLETHGPIGSKSIQNEASLWSMQDNYGVTDEKSWNCWEIREGSCDGHPTEGIVSFDKKLQIKGKLCLTKMEDCANKRGVLVRDRYIGVWQDHLNKIVHIKVFLLSLVNVMGISHILYRKASFVAANYLSIRCKTVRKNRQKDFNVYIREVFYQQ